MNKFLAMMLAAALWPLSAPAQTPVWNEIKGELKAALQLKGDPARGKAVFRPCQDCHHADASGSTDGKYPRLSGQHATVLMKQITDMREGRRINLRMAPYFEDHRLTPKDVADVGAYLQALPISGKTGKGRAAGIFIGKVLFEKDCETCHGAKGEGNAEKFYPLVAAQHYRYLLRQMRYIRDGDRRNSHPEMVKLIKSYTNAELESLADYMAQLQPPKK